MRRIAVLSVVALGLASCASSTASVKAAPPTKPKPVVPPFAQEKPVLIRNATLWVGNGKVLKIASILFDKGRIKAVGRAIATPPGAEVIDAKGRIVTPGLVDMHSHAGVYSSPRGMAHADGNEMTNPLTPMVRAIDAFDPEDKAIPRALAGGVTTALILPGSGNIMGGEALYVKFRGATVGDMKIRNPPRAMKMAMGENPKRVHGRKGRTPMSRMGHAWLMRKRFDKARKLRDKQRRWDKKAKTGTAKGPRPYDPGLEALIALLDGKVRLQVHCYEVHDIETLVRISHEFGFKVAAVHHALEAWKVPELLRANNIAVATFSDLWGFKMEAYDASVRGPKILHEKGVALAIKTDHPVIDNRDLAWEAAKAHHYGLPEQAAIAAITRVPAEAIGLGKRLGTLEVGKDADVLLWDRNPFDIGARPTIVWVDGIARVRK